MDTINSDYFAQPEYLRIAKGWDAPKLKELNDGSGAAIWSEWKKGEGGMLNPSGVTLQSGTTLIRFAGNSAYDKPDKVARPFVKQAIGGQWWVDWPNYQKIERFADQRKISIAEALSLTCAVPEDWSDMSVLVQVTTMAPISAYQGLGAPVTLKDERGLVTARIIPGALGKPEVHQLFIPGLANPDLCKRALTVSGYRLFPGKGKN